VKRKRRDYLNNVSSRPRVSLARVFFFRNYGVTKFETRSKRPLNGVNLRFSFINVKKYPYAFEVSYKIVLTYAAYTIAQLRARAYSILERKRVFFKYTHCAAIKYIPHPLISLLNYAHAYAHIINRSRSFFVGRIFPAVFTRHPLYTNVGRCDRRIHIVNK